VGELRPAQLGRAEKPGVRLERGRGEVIREVRKKNYPINKE
jgi:hypothetical protein